VVPGTCSAASISSSSCSYETWSGQARRHTASASHSGDHPDQKRSRWRHCRTGLSTTVVSIIENGAGSVEVSARPALPKTRSTSGNERSTRSCACSRRVASDTEMPGKVVGM
jgi:hypothetical protein